jgi:ethanolamine utilization cobalamin adenosyltransferase
VIVTESALREIVRRPKAGARVVVPRDAVLSPAAQDFVAHWQLELVPEDDTVEPEPVPETRAGWQRPSTFPVVTGQAPRCTTCGSEVADKPDALTQLNACHYVAKTHPRIRLRGRLDTLQALALLAAARCTSRPDVRGHLETIAAYCRELVSAEYNERKAAPVALDGCDEAEIHRATHDPRGVLGVDHVLPGTGHPELLHWVNLLRCEVREAELVALDAFPSPHDTSGASVVHGLNRLSSVVYYLELLLCRDLSDDEEEPG